MFFFDFKHENTLNFFIFPKLVVFIGFHLKLIHFANDELCLDRQASRFV